jgi:diadenosine tetraphosphate (Ap4A) HIT family hydrolase
MTAPRSRKEVKAYNKYQATVDKSVCTFCKLQETGEQIIIETPAFLVLRNRFPYSIWDSQQVVDHLMVVPKLHTDSLSELATDAAVEFLKVVSDYEHQGYNVYARAPGSRMKSIVHQHTHLIKTVGSPKKFGFLLRKPYIRVTL